MQFVVLAAGAATVLRFAAFIGLLASAAQDPAADRTAAAQLPENPLGRSFLIAARAAIPAFPGAWALYADAGTLTLLV